MKINDNRKNFKGITFSNYTKSHAIKELLKCIYYQKKEDALFWTGELLCSNCVLDIWNVYIQIMCIYINISNPKLPIYLFKKYNDFKYIANTLNDLDLRNNDEIRTLLFSITSILCECKKATILDSPEFKLSFDINSNLKAPNVGYIQPFFKSGDPKEYFIALNEFTYHLTDTKNKMDILYWIDWIIEYEITLLKKKKHTVCIKRDFAPNQNIIWVIWEVLLSFKGSVLEKIMEALFELFKIKYAMTSNKKKKHILHLGIMYIITPIDFQIKLIENNNVLDNLDKLINLTFERLKKNEII